METTVVTAAVIERDGRFLVTRRGKGVHLEGLWEFPGGKCGPGESFAECLTRELREELGVHADVGAELFATTHAYPDRIVELHFLECRIDGTPSGNLGQEMLWVRPQELAALEFPAADAEFIDRLARRAAS